MIEEHTKERKRNWFLHIISDHPIGTIVAFIGALFSIVAAGPALFPWWTAPKRALTYCINPIRTPIVQSTKDSEVTMSYRGTKIEGNLTAAQIAVWNAGREPIKREDILAPITLRIADNCRIFSVIISKTNLVNEFRFNLSSNDMVIGKLVLDWRILEKGEGALVQVVYAGTPETPIKLEGRIIGQTEPSFKRKSSPPNTLMVLLSGAFAVSVLEKITDTTRRKKTKVMQIISFALGLCLILASIFYLWFIWQMQFNKTPFGF